MLNTITKESICKKLLISEGILVDRFVSIQGLIRRVADLYYDIFRDYSITKGVENFIRDMSEVPVGYCIIKHLGQDDTGVIDAINKLFPKAEVIEFIIDVIVKERDILTVGRLYSKLKDSALKDIIGKKQYKRVMLNIENSIEKIKKEIESIPSLPGDNQAEKIYYYLTEGLHLDFYLDFLDNGPHSYEFVKKVIGDELALKAFRELLLLKKRTIKNQSWSWEGFSMLHAGAINDVMSWMGDKQNELTDDDRKLKRLFFDVMLK